MRNLRSKKMNLEKLKQAIEISKMLELGDQLESQDSHYEVGKPYMIQTVTAFYKGILEKLTPTEFVLTDCSWVADTGRFSEFVQDETDTIVKEEEPFPKEMKVIISRSAMLCAYKRKALVRKLK